MRKCFSSYNQAPEVIRLVPLEFVLTPELPMALLLNPGDLLRSMKSSRAIDFLPPSSPSASIRCFCPFTKSLHHYIDIGRIHSVHKRFNSEFLCEVDDKHGSDY